MNTKFCSQFPAIYDRICNTTKKFATLLLHFSQKWNFERPAHIDLLKCEPLKNFI